MDIAYQMANYLAAAGFGTLNSDVFVGHIPDGTNGIYVERTGGQAEAYLPIEESALNIYARNTSAASAIDKLEDIKRFIHRMHNTTTANAYIYRILLIGDVEDVDRDLEHAKTFRITVSVLHRDTALIS